MPKNKLEWAIVFAVVSDALSWIVFGYFTFYWGGDAGNGVVQAGHYYLSRPSHGEVSQRVFMVSLWDMRCLLASHSLTMLLLIVQDRQRRRSSKVT